MARTQTIVLSILIAITLLMAGAVSAQDGVTDPYQIFEKYIKAIGGFELVRAESTSYVESEIEVVGLTGTVKTWKRVPIYSRQDVDLKVFKNFGGDNGEVLWSADANGKVQFHRDEEILKRRKIQKYVAEYEYLNPDSKIFTLTLESEQNVNGTDCYVVKTKNSINDDSSLTFFDKKTFLMVKTIAFTPDAETHTDMSDYRDIGNGLLVSYYQEINTLPVEQKVINRVTKYEYNIDIDPSLFEPPGADTKDYRFTNGNSAENIPFKYYMSHIFLKVIMDCRERWWILDSGAGISVIDSTFAEELGLSQEGDMTGQGVGNTVSIKFVKCPSYRLEGIEFDEQTIGSIDLQSLLQKAGMEAAGVLGYDFMSRFVIKIDYANKLISFYDPETYEYKGDGSVVEALVKGSIFTVPATIDGKYSGQFNLDIGASGNAVHYPFAVKHGFTERKGVDGLSWGAGGELHGKDIKTGSLEIGGYIVKNPIIEVPLSDVVGGFGASETNGNIGNTFLRHFILYLNYDKQEIILEKGDDFDREFSPGRAGLQVMYDSDNNFEVVFVANGTPAHKAGFMKGDILKAINNIDVECFKDLQSISKIMMADAGTRLTIKIDRGGIEKTIKLKLQDIY
ncbi:MAG: aspartyl protease family protein [Candidatus Zixiibacteriota bacterium]